MEFTPETRALLPSQVRALRILLKDGHAEELQAKPLDSLSDLVRLGLAASQELPPA